MRQIVKNRKLDCADCEKKRRSAAKRVVFAWMVMVQPLSLSLVHQLGGLAKLNLECVVRELSMARRNRSTCAGASIGWCLSLPGAAFYW